METNDYYSSFEAINNQTSYTHTLSEYTYQQCMKQEVFASVAIDGAVLLYKDAFLAKGIVYLSVYMQANYGESWIDKILGAGSVSAWKKNVAHYLKEYLMELHRTRQLTNMQQQDYTHEIQRLASLETGFGEGSTIPAPALNPLFVPARCSVKQLDHPNVLEHTLFLSSSLSPSTLATLLNNDYIIRFLDAHSASFPFIRSIFGVLPPMDDILFQRIFDYLLVGIHTTTDAKAIIDLVSRCNQNNDYTDFILALEDMYVTGLQKRADTEHLQRVQASPAIKALIQSAHKNSGSLSLDKLHTTQSQYRPEGCTAFYEYLQKNGLRLDEFLKTMGSNISQQ